MSSAPQSSVLDATSRRVFFSRGMRMVILTACLLMFLLWTLSIFLQPPYPDAHNPPPRFSTEWWLAPVEQNAPNRLPLFENTRIRATEMHNDGQSIWIAGDKGNIQFSFDGGVIWEKAKIDWTIPSDNNRSIQMLKKAPPPASPSPAPASPAQPRKTSSHNPSKRPEVGGAGAEPGILLAASPEKVPIPNVVRQIPPNNEPKLQAQPQMPDVQQVPPNPNQAGISQIRPLPPSQNPEHMTIQRISVSSAEQHAWALAATSDSRYTPEVAILYSNDRGRSWKVIGVYEHEFSDYDHISVGFGGRGWLSLDGYPLMSSRGGTRFNRHDVEKETFYVHEGRINFNSSGTVAWMTGSKASQTALQVWQVITDRSGYEQFVLREKVKPSLGNIFAMASPEIAYSRGGDWSATNITTNSGDEWKLVTDTQGEKVAAAFDETLHIGVGASNLSGSLKNNVGWYVFRLEGDKALLVKSLDLLGLTRGQGLMALNPNAILFSRSVDTLSLLSAPNWEPRFITRKTLSVFETSSKEEIDAAAAQAATFGLPYRKFPPPIYYPIALLLLGGAWLSSCKLRRTADEEKAVQRAIADYFISDRPLEAGQVDALGSERIALGLADYLRNQQTGLPLTVAITGAWGSGKSSIMSLLLTELRKNGCYPVEFNAWHHQNEQHILAAMLDSIRKQAVQPIWHPDGALFRWRLALIRLRTRWFSATGYGMLIVAGGTLVVNNHTYFELLFKSGNLVDAVGHLLSSASGFGGLAGLGAVLAALWRAWQALGTFGVDPARLVVNASEQAGIRDLKGQTSLRYQFAQEFREVTQAMEPDMRMMLFIDDLDRCEPQHMMTVLENINFLTTAGKCAVVIGMDDEAVKDCLATHLEWRMKLERPLEQWSREQRHDFAVRWLEKLVQVSVGVPRITQEHVGKFVEGAAGKPPAATASQLFSILRHRFFLNYDIPLKAGIMFLCFLVACYVGSLAVFTGDPTHKPDPGYQFTGTLKPFDVTEENYSMLIEGAVKPAPKPGGTLEPVKPTLSLEEDDATRFIEPLLPDAHEPVKKMEEAVEVIEVPVISGEAIYEVGKKSWPWWTLIFFPALLVFGLPAWIILRKRLFPEVKESREVLDAFESWLRPLGVQLDTPRAMKGFLNKVRFYDMLSRKGKDRQERLPVSAEQIVAFGALSYCAPETIRDGQRELPTTLDAFPGCKQHAADVLRILRDPNTEPEIRAHFQLLSQSWKKRSSPAKNDIALQSAVSSTV